MVMGLAPLQQEMGNRLPTVSTPCGPHPLRAGKDEENTDAEQEGRKKGRQEKMQI
jgi:hypothetical protein